VETESEHVDKFEKLHLKSNEKIEIFVNGYIGNHLGTGDETHYTGSLIVTDERVAFFHEGEFGDIFKTVALSSITNIQRKSFFGHRTIKINTQDNSLTFKTFSRDCAQSIYSWLSVQLLNTANAAS